MTTPRIDEAELFKQFMQAIEGKQEAIALELLNQPFVLEFVLINVKSLLFKAAEQGLLGIVKALIEKEPTLLEYSYADSGQTLLVFAVEGGHVELVKYLLSKKANLNIVITHTRKTPLYLAVEQGQAEIVGMLIEAGASISPELLHIATKQGNVEIIRALLEKQPDLLEQKDENGETPLSLAVAKGHYEAVKYFLSLKDINPNSSNSIGKTPLYLAVEQDDVDIVTLLLVAKAEPIVKVGDKDFQPIHIAAQKGNVSIMKLLIEFHPNLLEKRDKYGQTALLWAAANGHVEAVKFLLSMDADPNCYSNQPNHSDDGKTPLYWAIERGHIEVVKLLLKADAHPVGKAAKWFIPVVHIPAKQGNLAMMKVLIETKPELLEQKDILGKTALFLAVEHSYLKKEHREVVEYLLSKNANPNIYITHSNNEDNGRTVLEWAGSNSEIKEMLLKAGAVDWVQFTRLIFDHNAQEALQILKQQHAAVLIEFACNKKNDICISAIAAGAGLKEVVEKLFELKPELLQQRDEKDETAFISAARMGHVEIVKFLLSKNVPFTHEDFEKALNSTRGNPLDGEKKVFEFLIEYRSQQQAKVDFKAYTDRIEKFKNSKGEIDFTHGFILFPKRRGRSREANYKAAIQLPNQLDLEEGKQMKDVFNTNNIVSTRNLYKPTQSMNDIRSSQLNGIFKRIKKDMKSENPTARTTAKLKTGR